MKYITLFFGLCALLFVGAGCIDAQADNQSGDYKMLKETLQLEESTVKGAGIIDKAEEALKKEESAINQKAKQAIKNLVQCDCPFEPHDCEDFLNQKEAQQVYDCCLRAFGTDIHDLDPDKDSYACELLP